MPKDVQVCLYEPCLKLLENSEENLEFCDKRGKVCAAALQIADGEETDQKYVHKYMTKKSKPCKNLILLRFRDSEICI
jgi:hypothetical protein